jgi:hypothetical protein
MADLLASSGVAPRTLTRESAAQAATGPTVVVVGSKPRPPAIVLVAARALRASDIPVAYASFDSGSAAVLPHDMASAGFYFVDSNGAVSAFEGELTRAAVAAWARGLATPQASPRDSEPMSEPETRSAPGVLTLNTASCDDLFATKRLVIVLPAAELDADEFAALAVEFSDLPGVAFAAFDPTLPSTCNFSALAPLLAERGPLVCLRQSGAAAVKASAPVESSFAAAHAWLERMASGDASWERLDVSASFLYTQP